MQLVRRLARVPGDEQCTTAVSVAEIAYAAARNGDKELAGRVRDLIAAASTVLPFDHEAAETYAVLRAQLERLGVRLDESSMRIAAIAVSHDLTLVTASARLYDRVPGLRIENWLEPDDIEIEPDARPDEETMDGRDGARRVRHEQRERPPSRAWCPSSRNASASRPSGPPTVKGSSRPSLTASIGKANRGARATVLRGRLQRRRPAEPDLGNASGGTRDRAGRRGRRIGAGPRRRRARRRHRRSRPTAVSIALPRSASRSTSSSAISTPSPRPRSPGPSRPAGG